MKKLINKLKSWMFLFLFLLSFSSCEKFLEEEISTQYDPNALLKDQSGIDALLTGAYASTMITGVPQRDYLNVLQEFPTDIAWETGGGLERLVIPIMQFNWDPSTVFFNSQYDKFYTAISRANNVLTVTSSITSIEQNKIEQANAEAKYIRAFSYYILHNLFGPTPIIEIPKGASIDEIESIGKETPRATEEEYRVYVEADLMYAVEKLDEGGLSSRANKGSALALLAKFYLNNKEWEKAANAAQRVLDMNYALYGDYIKLFSVQGENNNEYIYRFEALIGSSQVNEYMAHAFPPNFPIMDNWVNYGAQYRTYTSFYETFEEQDIRRQAFLTEYTPVGSSDLVQLVRDKNNNPLDNVRSFKYVPDPNAIGQQMGNDIPYIRLADIILAKAEALNELNGPTQESIDLINQIRERANASLINLTDFSSKESLRNFILAERGREFFTEGLRREDLIRHGKFIEQAIEREIDAKSYQVRYPLPQAQIDNNPNLEQNPGYN